MLMLFSCGTVKQETETIKIEVTKPTLQEVEFLEIQAFIKDLEEIQKPGLYLSFDEYRKLDENLQKLFLYCDSLEKVVAFYKGSDGFENE